VGLVHNSHGMIIRNSHGISRTYSVCKFSCGYF